MQSASNLCAEKVCAMKKRGSKTIRALRFHVSSAFAGAFHYAAFPQIQSLMTMMIVRIMPMMPMLMLPAMAAVSVINYRRRSIVNRRWRDHHRWADRPRGRSHIHGRSTDRRRHVNRRRMMEVRPDSDAERDPGLRARSHEGRCADCGREEQKLFHIETFDVLIQGFFTGIRWRLSCRLSSTYARRGGQ